MYPYGGSAVYAVVFAFAPFVCHIIRLASDFIFCKVICLQKIPAFLIDGKLCVSVFIGCNRFSVCKKLTCLHLSAALRFHIAEEKAHGRCRRLFSGIVSKTCRFLLDGYGEGFSCFRFHHRLCLKLCFFHPFQILPWRCVYRAECCAQPGLRIHGRDESDFIARVQSRIACF